MLGHNHKLDLHNLQSRHQSMTQDNNRRLHSQLQSLHHTHLERYSLLDMCHKFRRLYMLHRHIQQDHHQDNYILYSPNCS